MRYPYGFWHHLYWVSGLKLSLETRTALHRALRPLPSDPTLAAYRERATRQIPDQLQIPALARMLPNLEADEWNGRWDHAAWHPQHPRRPFAHDEQQRPLYPLPAVCARCGHEFLGREAISAPSLGNCRCFWCTGALRPLPRYPLPGQQTMLDLG